MAKVNQILKIKLLLIAFVAFSSCGNSQEKAETTKKISDQFIANYNKSDYTAIFELCSERMKTAFPKKETVAFLTSVKSNFGEVKNKIFLKVTDKGFTSYKVITNKKPFLLNIAAVNNKIEGFSIKQYKEDHFKPSKEFILDFIKNNPDKSSVKLIKNGTVYTEFNANRMMPLASTVKTVIAIEYAEQASKGIINADDLISISDLEKFYIPNTDGGAHPKWLESVENKIVNQQISIREIAKGVIWYSSNANTEWLCDKLGLHNINNRLKSLNIKKHSEIYFIVSALFVGKEKSTKLEGDSLEQTLRNLSDKEYVVVTNRIHQKLISDSNYKNDLGKMVEKVWSDKLPASTTNEYVGLLQKINSRTYFSPKTQQYLDEVMETYMQNPGNRRNWKHLGGKGGSTAWILTKALYGTDKKGNTTEAAYFFNNLNEENSQKIYQSINEFELGLLLSRKVYFNA